jgi:catechol 2,3-dioxygenase-like lactoylglutathione lyase family enzyme
MSTVQRHCQGSPRKRGLPAQDAKGLNLNVIGVGAKNLPESANFYQKIMGFKVAFTFGGTDPEKMTYYDQPGRDSFLELQPVAANATPGLSHFHLLTNNLDATIARLKQNGFTTAAGRMPGTMDEAPGVSPGAKTRNINVYDPDGVRIEINEYGPGSLPKQAVDAWY